MSQVCKQPLIEAALAFAAKLARDESLLPLRSRQEKFKLDENIPVELLDDLVSAVTMATPRWRRISRLLRWP